MSKIISAKAGDVSESPKLVSIKHTKVMQNANGNNVTVLDYEQIKEVGIAIADAEALKINLEEQLAEVTADLVEYKAIQDAE
tara:strand:- start:240 stop:485 length:246 start_codon:yes stop_codon:yes gene_type:complete